MSEKEGGVAEGTRPNQPYGHIPHPCRRGGVLVKGFCFHP